MPYIRADRRDAFVVGLSALNREIASSGELNYVITRLILNYWLTAPCYTRIAEVTGVVKNVADEFYRRVAAPYENQKIRENGDVYP